MGRLYATLDRNGAGVGLALEQNGLVVTNEIGTAASPGMNSLARATLAPAGGKAFFEAAFYGEGVLLDRAAVGIVGPRHSLAAYVGEQDAGYGLKVGNGGIWRNGVAVVDATVVPPVGKKVFVGVLFDATARTCTWYVNGSLAARVTGIATGLWYPAVSVSGAKANDLRCYVNFGQHAFAFPQDGTDNYDDAPVEGWYSEGDTIDPLYLCPRNSAGFTSQAGDALPLVTFEPRIANADAMSVSTRSSVWPWGNGNSGSSYGELEVDNADGKYDEIAGYDLRDQVARIVSATAGSSYDAANVVFTAVVDDVRCVGESRLRFAFKDMQTTLERPLQRRIFPPWSDPGVAFRPLPITLGACRNVAPILEDQVALRYRLHDAPITNITAVRDKGTLLDKYASPPQYVPTNDLQGFALHAAPVGLLTADVSSEGAQVVIPGVADIIEGAGAFTNWPNPALPPAGMPNGGPQWVFHAGSSGSGLLYRKQVGDGSGSPQNYVAVIETADFYIPQPSGESHMGSHLSLDAAILEPGKTYRIQFKLVRTVGRATDVTIGRPAGLMVRSDLTIDPRGAISPHLQPLTAPQYGTQGTAYTFTYTVPPGAARRLYFIVSTAEALNVSNGMGGKASANLFGIKVERLGDVEQALPLEGITLERYWSEIFRRAGVPESAWARQDCADIDARTGYRFGVHIRDPITVLAALRLPLDTFGAAMFTDAQGRFRVRRLVDPKTAPSVAAEFTASDIPRGVTPRNDLAPGLTSSIGARRNWQPFNDSDFVTDFVLVPAATRTQFKAKYQFVRNAPAALRASYGFASSAPELESLLDDPAQAQAEILRMAEPYALGRGDDSLRKLQPTLPRFLEFSAHYDGASPPPLVFGDVIRVTYPRHRLNGGQRLVVVGTTINPYTKTMQIVAWGTL